MANQLQKGHLKNEATLREILPKQGLVYSERGSLSEVLCKPKILPLKSAVLEQLKKIEQAVEAPVEDLDEREDGKGSLP